MSPLSRLRREPWLAGAVLLVFAGALVSPLVFRFGWRYWPFYVGVAALLLLLAGVVERRWKSRAVSYSLPRPARRPRFRVVPGGKSGKKGNGEAPPDPDDEDKPRWVM